MVRFGALTQQRLEHGEGVLDGVEVGTVGREVGRFRAGRLDHLTQARPLVARQVVHDDDVAGTQFRNQDLLDTGLEGVAVDWPVEHLGSNEAANGQRTDEGRRLPVAMRYADPKPLAARQPPWRRAMLVDAQVSSMNTNRPGSRSS